MLSHKPLSEHHTAPISVLLTKRHSKPISIDPIINIPLHRFALAGIAYRCMCSTHIGFSDRNTQTALIHISFTDSPYNRTAPQRSCFIVALALLCRPVPRRILILSHNAI